MTHYVYMVTAFDVVALHFYISMLALYILSTTPVLYPYLGEPLAHGKSMHVLCKLSVLHVIRILSLTSNNLNIKINDKDSHETTEQVTKFHDGNPSWVYEVPHSYDITRSTIETSNESMQDFFSRPIRVSTFNWATGGSLFIDFDPWALFWENKRNINKIATYNLLRCRLHVNFRINGNAFLYGRLIASYIPFQGSRKNDDMTVDRFFIKEDVVEASQRPHVYIDPTTNSGGEMILPFFYWKNYWKVPQRDWRDMGNVIIHTINPLKHANGAEDTITVQVYVHATDVEFGMPTSVNPEVMVPQAFPEYEPQSGKSTGTEDEYERSAGVISAPLNTVAKIAGMLKSAPVVGPYAKATQIAASGMSNVAKIFGYSRPIQVEGSTFQKIEYAGNLVNHNAVDTAIKLSADIKQETTIDSRIAGLDGTDEMVITDLAMRESFVTTFDWATTAAPDDCLFVMNCSPAMYSILTSTPREYHFTPSCFVSQLFGYWHGTMNIRLQFVCSKYHKGRIKIVYDPNFIDLLKIDNEDNVNYTQVIDLAETRDITIRVPWGQNRHWLDVTDVSTVNDALQYSTTGGVVTPPGALSDITVNGQIGIFVINELTTPNSSINNDIEVNVFTSMCDDFCLSNPTGRHVSDLTYFPQSGPEYVTDDEDFYDYEEEERINQSLVALCAFLYKMQHPCRPYDRQASPEAEMDGLGGCEGDNAPVTTDDCEMPLENSTAISPLFHDIYPGEAIVSLRSMMKRYIYHRSYAQTTSQNGIMSLTQSVFPMYRGDPAGAVDTTTTPVGTWNYNMMTLINYIVPAFAGYRGAIRWKVMLTQGTSMGSNLLGANRLYRSNNGFYHENIAPLASSASLEEIAVAGQYVQSNFGSLGGQSPRNSTMDGAAIINARNGALEVEFPFYSRERFYPAKLQNKNTSNGFSDYWYSWSVNTRTSAAPTFVDYWCATGEDFNCFFFTGTPVVYYVDNPVP